MAPSIQALQAWAQAAYRIVQDAVCPHGCAACDTPIPHPHAFCDPCRATLAPPRGGGGAAQVCAFGTYGGALEQALRRLKYSDRPDLAEPLGALAVEAARATGCRADLVVPVPLHPRRLAERGYNQAALLARPVARALEARFGPRALARTRVTAAQARLAGGERGANVAGAFAVPRPGDVASRRVLLVDDVATTGSTLAACASSLRAAGAHSVSALVVAVAEWT